ncbi:MAG: hypothetical protein IPG45_06060 [Deltaproteobacteria bacterium]|nr:hypothetical protein [Deltaproteobacteria bacterium]
MIRSEERKGVGLLAERRASLYAEFVRSKGLEPATPIPPALQAEALAWVEQALIAWQQQNGGSGKFERPGPWGQTTLSVLAERSLANAAQRPTRMKVAGPATEPWAVRMLIQPRPHKKGMEVLADFVQHLAANPGLESGLAEPARLLALFEALGRLARGEARDAAGELERALTTRRPHRPLGPLEQDLLPLRDLLLVLAKAARSSEFSPAAYRSAELLAAVQQTLVHLAAGGALDLRAKAQLYDMLDRIEAPLAS